MSAASLLAELRDNQSSLVGLIERVERSEMPFVVVDGAALARWVRREPDNWAKVQAWFDREKIAVVII